MSRNTVSLLGEMNEEKTKILRWVIEWLKYPNYTLNNNETDTLELVSLFQCLGFNLDSLKKRESENDLNTTYTDVNITITCQKSKMLATMSKTISSCNCPTAEVASNAHMWSISGCAPNSDRINTSNSSIIPSLSPTKNKVIGELLQKVLQTIHSPERPKRDTTNIGISKEEPPLVLHKLDTSLEAASLPKPVTQHKSIEALKNEATNLPLFELEGPSSPPKSCSSPITDISVKINMQDCEKLSGLLKNIMQLTEEAYNVTAGGHNTTFPRANRKKRISDIKVSPLAGGEMPIAGNFINLNVTRTKEFSLLKNNTPQKGGTPGKKISGTPIGAKKMLPPVSSRYGISRSRAMTPTGTTRTPTGIKPLTPHSDTPRPGSSKDSIKSKMKYTPLSTHTIKIPGGENMPAGVSRLKPPGKLLVPAKKK